MKNITSYQAAKYHTQDYKEVEPHIYKTLDTDSLNEDAAVMYVTSIQYEPEPARMENQPGELPSQYPLEDILDEFLVWCSDMYDKENQADTHYSYVEFASSDLADIKGLLSIIGKHVYNKEDDHGVHLVIE